MATYVRMQHCQTEWDAGALENGELTQLRAAYKHQLEEQIALAKLDIVNALQEQIQVAQPRNNLRRAASQKSKET